MKTTTLILQLLVNRLTFSGKSWYFSQALDYLLWFNITVNYFDEYLTFKIEKFRTTYVQSSSNNKDNIYWKIKEYHPSLPPTSPTYCPVWSGCLSFIRQTQQLGITRRFPAPKWPWIHNIYWRYAAWRWHLLQSSSLGCDRKSFLYLNATSKVNSSKAILWKSWKRTIYLHWYC